MTVPTNLTKRPPMSSELAGVLVEIAEERARQEELWGEQNHPVLSSSPNTFVARRSHAARADVFKRRNDRRAKESNLAWDDIILEEVYEALAEEDPARIRAELVQAAAVVVNMIQGLDRAAGRNAGRP